MRISIRTNAIVTSVGGLVVLVVALFPSLALAYIGPGAGLSVVGSALALLGAILLAIFGFVFYPIRRLLRRRKERSMRTEQKSPGESSEPKKSGDSEGEQSTDQRPDQAP